MKIEHGVKDFVLRMFVCMYVSRTVFFIYYLLLISKMSEKMTFSSIRCHEQV